MTMWEKVILVFSKMGRFLFLLLKTTAAQEMQKIGDDVLEIVKQVELECAGSCSGQDKFNKALTLAIAKFPGIALRVVRSAIENSVLIISEDTDSDGVVDVFDPCPDDPNCK